METGASDWSTCVCVHVCVCTCVRVCTCVCVCRNTFNFSLIAYTTEKLSCRFLLMRKMSTLSMYIILYITFTQAPSHRTHVQYNTFICTHTVHVYMYIHVYVTHLPLASRSGCHENPTESRERVRGRTYRQYYIHHQSVKVFYTLISILHHTKLN